MNTMEDIISKTRELKQLLEIEQAQIADLKDSLETYVAALKEIMEEGVSQ